MNPDTTTVSEFGRWLAARQQTALEAMQSSTGTEFIRHLDDYTAMATAYRAILIFERETKYQARPCAAPGDKE